MDLLKDFISLIYPHLCASCGKTLYKHEYCICSYCKISFPETNFHLEKDNPVSKIFWGRVNIHCAAAFCYFRKGDNIQNVMHQLKYKGNQAIGVEMGRLYGLKLKNSEWFNPVEIIIPVPLHHTRLKKRGYNQAEQIAIGLSETMKATVNTSVLIRKTATDTQTRKTHYERWKNVDTIFHITDQETLANKHILLVDDVVTTGATLEACAQALSQVNGIKISIATLAFA